MPESANKNVASRKEEYELLYGMLKGGYTGLIDFEFKHAGLMALVIGWLVTSERAQLVVARRLHSSVGTIVKFDVDVECLADDILDCTNVCFVNQHTEVELDWVHLGLGGKMVDSVEESYGSD